MLKSTILTLIKQNDSLDTRCEIAAEAMQQNLIDGKSISDLP